MSASQEDRTTHIYLWRSDESGRLRFEPPPCRILDGPDAIVGVPVGWSLRPDVLYGVVLRTVKDADRFFDAGVVYRHACDADNKHCFRLIKPLDPSTRVDRDPAENPAETRH